MDEVVKGRIAYAVLRNILIKKGLPLEGEAVREAIAEVQKAADVKEDVAASFIKELAHDVFLNVYGRQ